MLNDVTCIQGFEAVKLYSLACIKSQFAFKIDNFPINSEDKWGLTFSSCSLGIWSCWTKLDKLLIIDLLLSTIDNTNFLWPITFMTVPIITLKKRLFQENVTIPRKFREQVNTGFIYLLSKILFWKAYLEYICI